MKKLLLLPFLLILIVAIGGFWFYKNSLPVTQLEKFDYFIIAKGSSAGLIGNKLESAGLIKSALAFKIYLQFTGQSGKLQSGEFRLTPSYSLFQTVSALFKGPVELWVTVPEGLRREEIAQKFGSTWQRQLFCHRVFTGIKRERRISFPGDLSFSKRSHGHGGCY